MLIPILQVWIGCHHPWSAGHVVTFGRASGFECIHGLPLLLTLPVSPSPLPEPPLLYSVQTGPYPVTWWWLNLTAQMTESL